MQPAGPELRAGAADPAVLRRSCANVWRRPESKQGRGAWSEAKSGNGFQSQVGGTPVDVPMFIRKRKEVAHDHRMLASDRQVSEHEAQACERVCWAQAVTSNHTVPKTALAYATPPYTSGALMTWCGHLCCNVFEALEDTGRERGANTQNTRSRTAAYLGFKCSFRIPVQQRTAQKPFTKKHPGFQPRSHMIP